MHEWLKAGDEWHCVNCHRRMINVANLEDALRADLTAAQEKATKRTEQLAKTADALAAALEDAAKWESDFETLSENLGNERDRLEAERDKFAAELVAAAFEVDELREQRDALRTALREIEVGVDHPHGKDVVPSFYEAIEWASGIAREALGGKS